MQRRRYVATQEESAPGPDGLPYSVCRLSTSSSRSTPARPSFFYGLGHMHGGSDLTNFSPSVFSLVLWPSTFEESVGFVLGTMKHS